MDLNYDTMRAGRTFEIQAKNYADDRVKDMNPDEAAVQRPVYFQERLTALVNQHNRDTLQKMPASGLMVSDDNRNVKVTRYRLKEDATPEQGRAAIREREALLTSVEWDGEASTLDTIIARAFVIEEVTMSQAADDKALKRSPIDCVLDAENPALPSAPTEKLADVQIDPWGDLPPIPGDMLVARLEARDMTHVDLAERLSTKDETIHHATVKSWLKRGVPEHFILEVRAALA